jgi:hypothetical protein
MGQPAIASSSTKHCILVRYVEVVMFSFFVFAREVHRFVILASLCEANISSRAFQTPAACSI